ncbi:MAG: FAD-dependent oxidoreductase, partial [Myxococcota bacterium]|nr:FAD-dependent oxidoreductase [Myxococcota bacterium]
MAINDLKRFVVEHEGPGYEPELDEAHGGRVAIVGAGPAGLAAAHDLRLRGWEVSLFDRADAPGGMLRYGIPKFRLPQQALESDVKRILDLGVEFIGGRSLGEDLWLEDLLEEFDRVLIAVGAWRTSALDLPREGSGGPTSLDALDFLHDSGTAAAGLRVAVIGGGNAGIDTARSALRAGALQVSVIEREAEIPALFHEVDAARLEGADLLPGLTPTALVGGDIRGVRCQGGAGEGGLEHVPADLVVIAVGQEIERGLWRDSDPKLVLGPGG